MGWYGDVEKWRPTRYVHLKNYTVNTDVNKINNQHSTFGILQKSPPHQHNNIRRFFTSPLTATTSPYNPMVTHRYKIYSC
jgi:hypothetical protein